MKIGRICETDWQDGEEWVLFHRQATIQETGLTASSTLADIYRMAEEIQDDAGDRGYILDLLEIGTGLMRLREELAP